MMGVVVRVSLILRAYLLRFPTVRVASKVEGPQTAPKELMRRGSR